MRHRKSFNHLGRKKAHRKALLQNLSISLIEHKRIRTTLAKAKALRKHIEPILTKAKTNDTHNRRFCFQELQNKEAVKELFDVVAPKVGDRPGGYTRVLRTGFRRNDGAEMAIIELVDFNEVYTGKIEKATEEDTRRTRRSRRSKKKSTENTTTTENTVETQDEDIVDDFDEDEEEK